jgi:DNA replication protein DnaC
MNDDLDQLLKSLRLRRIPGILDREVKRAEKESPSYSEFLARLLREEYLEQQRRNTDARIKRARMPESWTLDTFPWKRQPGVDKKQIRQLAELEFVRTGTNLVLTGGTGVGKTGLAISLLRAAVQSGYRGYFIKAQDLFDEMYASLADRSTRRFLKSLTSFDLICIDELGYLNLRPEQTNIFFKLMDDRYTARRATIITSNLSYDDWAAFLANKHLTEALLSRLRHRCQTIHIAGPSLRAPDAETP